MIDFSCIGIVIQPAIAREKASGLMIANTEYGDWNCDNTSMAMRLAQLKADRVPELSIFGTNDIGAIPGGNSPTTGPNCDVNHSTWVGHKNPDGHNQCACAMWWFPFAREFLADNDDDDLEAA